MMTSRFGAYYAKNVCCVQIFIWYDVLVGVLFYSCQFFFPSDTELLFFKWLNWVSFPCDTQATLSDELKAGNFWIRDVEREEKTNGGMRNYFILFLLIAGRKENGRKDF